MSPFRQHDPLIRSLQCSLLPSVSDHAFALEFVWTQPHVSAAAIISVHIMQVSSAAIALTLLQGAQAASAAPKPVVAAAPKAEVAPTTGVSLAGVGDREFTAQLKTLSEYGASKELLEAHRMGERISALNHAIEKGEVSPLGPEVHDLHPGAVKLTYPGREFEGQFIARIGLEDHFGRAAPVTSDTAFLDRRDAMVTAYHFATQFFGDIKSVAKEFPYAPRDAAGSIYGLSASGDFINTDAGYRLRDEKGTFQLILNMRTMENAGSALAMHFSFDKTGATAAAYNGQRSGISITHGAYGKIMDISAEGDVTLYDAQGKAFSAEEYNAANTKERIPALQNDLLDLAEANAKREKFANALMTAGKPVPEMRRLTLL